MNGLALCAGYGGLELGIERVFDEYKTVCYVEGEAFAASHLIKKMEEGRMDNAPIWSNIKSFEGGRWSGKVDFISGGFPCKPYSTAGKKMGKDDPSDLWPDFVRIIGEVRPGFLFFENVPNVVKLRLNQIILDLDKLGYSCSWGNLAASDVGARHIRNRWFLFAIKNPDTNRFRFNENKQSSPTGKLDFEGLCGVIPNTVNHIDKWGGGFDSWWQVEPSMDRLVDGATDWVDKLRLLGNGVVPQQAAYALQILGERLACGVVENRTPKD